MTNNDVQWEHYLTRPFSLFGSSFWHEWYLSDIPRNVIGANMPDALFVEQQPGVVRNYRDSVQLKKFKEAIQKIAQAEPERLALLLECGRALNVTAKKKLAVPEPGETLESAVAFVVELALHAATIPYFAGEYVTENERLTELIEELRAASYYPRLLAEVVVPLAVKKLKEKGIPNPKDAFENLTLREILNDSSADLHAKLASRDPKKRFVYENRGGVESVRYVADTADLLGELEGATVERQEEVIAGSIAYPGVVRGTARVVLTTDGKGAVFNEGDVLVSINSNPNLMPLINKCSAIVTDEGGITCHAAIISRELKKPCIIGTRVATKVLKTGDLVEVDANSGTITVLQKS